ncbi:MAG: glycosyltransferase [Nitrososphaerota archaeon]|nr:glycosyltransferase [Nitrososphaerota archaeon]
MGLSWSWIHIAMLLYEVATTAFLLFNLTGAYLYKPIPDQGYRPSVSVIVPVYNEEQGIARTIDAIFSSNYPKNKFELFVVDDKSTDDSLTVIKQKQLEHGFKVVEHDVNTGKRHATASGLKKCSGEIVVCIDSDAEISPDTITNLVQPFINKEVYAVCGNAMVSNEYSPEANSIIARFQKVWYAGAFRIRKASESLLGMVTCCSGVLSAYRREKIEAVLNAWLEETFFGRRCVTGDDRQMTNFMLQLGGKTVYQSNAMVYTIAPPTLQQFIKQQTRWGRSSVCGFLFAAKLFLHRKWNQKLVFYTTLFITFATPLALIASLTSLIWLGSFEVVTVYIAWLMLVSVVFALTTKILVDYFTREDFVYRTFFFVMMLALSFVYLYAYVTSYKGGTKWMTR